MIEYDQAKSARELHPWRYFWSHNGWIAKVLTVLLVAVIPTLLLLLLALFSQYLAPTLFGW